MGDQLIRGVDTMPTVNLCAAVTIAYRVYPTVAAWNKSRKTNQDIANYNHSKNRRKQMKMRGIMLDNLKTFLNLTWALNIVDPSPPGGLLGNQENILKHGNLELSAISILGQHKKLGIPTAKLINWALKQGLISFRKNKLQNNLTKPASQNQSLWFKCSS